MAPVSMAVRGCWRHRDHPSAVSTNVCLGSCGPTARSRRCPPRKVPDLPSSSAWRANPRNHTPDLPTLVDTARGERGTKRGTDLELSRSGWQSLRSCRSCLTKRRNRMRARAREDGWSCISEVIWEGRLARGRSCRGSSSCGLANDDFVPAITSIELPHSSTG
jgi:hypothetical protein